MDLKGKAYFESVRRAWVRAFTVIELLVVIAVVFVLMALLLPARAKSRSETHAVIDLSNVHQIVEAVHLFAAENSDFLPHSTWGSVPAGPTGWLYASGMPSGALPTIATTDQVDRVISNQLVYFGKGQLASYVGNDQKVFECPTDVAQRRSGTFKLWYMQRAVKLSAYTFTGAISGFGAPKQAANANTGGTFKLTQFKPSNFLMWEADETIPFNFNDAASNQENANEGVSFRHTASAGSTGARGNGVALRGAFGGDAAFIKPKTFTILRTAPAPNDLRCGPGY